MNQHAHLAESALASFDVEALLAQLPAKVRAGVLWVRPVMEEMTSRLQHEPLDDQLLEDVGREAMRPVKSLGLAFWGAYAAKPEMWRAEVAAALRRDVDHLEFYLPDKDSRESLAWIRGLLTSFFDELLRHAGALPGDAIAEAIEDVPDDLPAELVSFITAQLALMAALDLAKSKGDPGRASELIDVAFLKLLAFKDEMAREGLLLTPFPNETPQERRQRTVRYAELCRNALSEEDMKVFEDARLRTLR